MQGSSGHAKPTARSDTGRQGSRRMLVWFHYESVLQANADWKINNAAASAMNFLASVHSELVIVCTIMLPTPAGNARGELIRYVPPSRCTWAPPRSAIPAVMERVVRAAEASEMALEIASVESVFPDGSAPYAVTWYTCDFDGEFCNKNSYLCNSIHHVYR